MTDLATPISRLAVCLLATITSAPAIGGEFAQCVSYLSQNKDQPESITAECKEYVSCLSQHKAPSKSDKQLCATIVSARRHSPVRLAPGNYLEIDADFGNGQVRWTGESVTGKVK